MSRPRKTEQNEIDMPIAQNGPRRLHDVRNLQDTDPLLEHTTATNDPSHGRAAVIILAVTCSTFISALMNGIFSVAIPPISKDVNLDRSLMLWPQSIVSLVSACTLLLAGSFSDVVGSKLVYVLGSLLQTCFILATGVAQSGLQLLVFRGFMGLAQSMCLPTSVSLITHTLPAGRQRNIGFACMGGGQPLGFCLGLILGGVFATTVGWRAGMFLIAGLNAMVVVVASLGLPADHDQNGTSSLTEISIRLGSEIDWIGVTLISIALGLFSYVLGMISSDVSKANSQSSIILLCTAALLTLSFALWERHQTRNERPALIPNSLWRNAVFTSTCLCVFFTWGAFNTFEQQLSLWMQLIQRFSPLQASVQFLPQTIVGVFINLAIGISVHRISCGWTIISSSVISLGAPILMALSKPSWSYWAASFPAMCLNVVGADCLYTISNVIISNIFSANEQGLAGGVLNTIAQIGRSVGLALSAVVTEVVIDHHTKRGDDSALIDGYQASFWLCFGLAVLSTCVAVFGLRKLDRIGAK